LFYKIQNSEKQGGWQNNNYLKEVITTAMSIK